MRGAARMVSHGGVLKTLDFGTVLEATRFPQNKRLTAAVSKGFSEQRTARVFLSLGDVIHSGAAGHQPINAVEAGIYACILG